MKQYIKSTLHLPTSNKKIVFIGVSILAAQLLYHLFLGV